MHLLIISRVTAYSHRLQFHCNKVVSNYVSTLQYLSDENSSPSRFKLILGHVQLDNQLPLTLMPVLLAPEPDSDMHHPVFKMTITMRNENTDGIQVYPYIYIRVMLLNMMPKIYFISFHTWAMNCLSSDQSTWWHDR